ncbi:type IV secretory system conjugative DNA transfer family protein [Polycladidibacter hongkongensis]|uniref:type IV secretory system conjugative DNA transfer family protein n=1 Tax=Polycladidibacter hongkongensis TaxID=1647556 RepID=UPI000834D1A3|nr:type IV secretory system conjugative DNA transfer family protein [Pseudovibrio hongkongensis]
MVQLFGLLSLGVMLAIWFAGWNLYNGFDPSSGAWWRWLLGLAKRGEIPQIMQYIFWGGIVGGLATTMTGRALMSRIGNTTTSGEHQSGSLHGSAAWATQKDVEESGLLRSEGVVVGGWRAEGQELQTLRHDGPEHVLAFAPTRSGKGVGLVLPTLLSWRESALVLDIKGENFALTAGWRAKQGQRIMRFDPAAVAGSCRYNPLAEIRKGSDHEIADCQNIAAMIIDPDGTGMKDFWMQEGFSWLSTAILHVIYRIQANEKRTATLADVHAFMSVGDDMDEGVKDEEIRRTISERASGKQAKEDDSFDRLLRDMEAFDHKREAVNAEVRRGAARMRKRASNERSGVHSTGTSQLALYSDPIVARNTSACDFTIADLMSADHPMTLYIVISPADIARLRPLVRILLNQFLTRLTASMDFKEGRAVKHYKHRLLLMLDEFTSVGKLEIFEKALAFMAGYGLKAFIIIQDLAQIQKAYGREEAITSNAHVKIAYAPNRIETAKLLSDMTGKTTIVQRRKSRSQSLDKPGTSISESTTEVARPLMTPDECMTMAGMRTDASGEVTKAGEMLILLAGRAPIMGEQVLYFKDADLLAKARLAPVLSHSQPAPSPVADTQQPITNDNAGRAAFKARVKQRISG